jgi:hypothetical protein
MSKFFFDLKTKFVKKNTKKNTRELKNFSQFKSKIEKLYYKENFIF